MGLGYYKIQLTTITFLIGYNKDFVTLIKEIPGRRFNIEDKSWSCPINLVTTNPIKNLISKFDLQELPEDGVSVSGLELLPEDVESASKGIIESVEQRIKALGLGRVPRPYQLSGIAYNLVSKRCVNGSDMGTGKTFTSIFTIELENLFPCLVITTATTKYNWQDQWKIINPNRTVSVLQLDKQNDFNSDVLIINYGSLADLVKVGDKKVLQIKFEELLQINLVSLICDESQYLKGKDSIRSKAVKKISKKLDWILFLTGTFIMNRHSEVINPLETLRQFNTLFGNWINFVERYCDGKQTNYGWDINGSTNGLELNQKLKSLCYYRVEKRDVLKYLPEIEYTIFTVDLTNRNKYKFAENNLIEFLKQNYGRKASNAARKAKELVLLNVLRKLTSKGKISAITEWLDTYLESTQSKIIVFGVHTEILEELSKDYDADIIYGGTSPEESHRIVKDFKINDKRVLFLNILSAGVGIDGLQEVCSDALIIELPNRWTDVDQAISRIERDGQENHIHIRFLLGKDTVDLRILDMLLNKKLVTDKMNKGIAVSNDENFDEVFESYLK